MNIVKMNASSLKGNPLVNEKMVQEFICSDPSVLGLGDVYVKDKERIQPRAGRLDLLLSDSDDEVRYEVEIQLGKTDESHIIRTIEYWDIEKNRFPKYEHRAVIVAEEITSRFFNVLQILNRSVPLIAIQMQSFELDGKLGLNFTKIIDVTEVEEDDDSTAVEWTDRPYWEEKGSKDSVKMVDVILGYINEIQSGFEVKYNKHYIGLFRNGQASNFAIFRAKRKWIRIEIRLQKNAEIEKELGDVGIEILQYNERWKRLYLKMDGDQIVAQSQLIKKLFKISLDEWNG